MRRALVFSLLTLLLAPNPASALPGDYDATFGIGGRVFESSGVDIAIQPDGKLLAGGSTALPLRRYLPDGTRDETFVSQFHTLPIPDVVLGLVVQPDGRILVLANDFGANHGYLVRLLGDGSLDPDFGTGGSADDPPVIVSFRDMVLQPDGAIVVGGSVQAGGGTRDFALARYDANGEIDATFGTDGVAVETGGFGDSWIAHLGLQSDGKIVGYGPRVVLRWDDTGVLDPSFGTAGRATVGPVAQFTHGLVVQPDDAIVGTYHVNHSPGGTFRLLPDGAPDPSFGTGGTTTVWGSSVVLQPDGKLVLSQVVSRLGRSTVRLLDDGTVDPTFAGDTSHPVYAEATCVALDDAGRLVCRAGVGFIRIFGGTCGDAVVDGGEDCDDGNLDDGDACDAHCCTADGDGDGRCDAIDPCTGGSAFEKTNVKIQQRGTGERMIIKGQAPIPSPVSPPLDPVTNGVRLRIDGVDGNLLDVTVPGGDGWSVVGTPGRRKWTWDGDYMLAGLNRIKLQERPNRFGQAVKFEIQAYDNDVDTTDALEAFRDPENQPISVSLVLDVPTATTGQCGTATFPGTPGPSCRVTQVTKLTCK